MNQPGSVHGDTPAIRPWRGPCAADPAGWDLDAGTLTQWLAAMRTCLNCPMLQLCLQARQEMFPGSAPGRPARNPAGVIWAGVAYSDTGHAMDAAALRTYAARSRGRRLDPGGTGVDRTVRPLAV